MARWLTFALLLVICVSTLEARIWTDSTGKFRVDAKFVALRNGKVYLEKPDGTVISLPISRLSSDDVKYLNSLENKPMPGKAEKAPADSKKTRPMPRGKTAPISPGGFAQIEVDKPNTIGEVRNFGEMGWGVKSLSFSPNGGLIAAGKMDESLLVFDVNKKQQVSLHEKLSGIGQVTCVQFTPNGKRLLSGGYRGRIQVWDVSKTGALEEGNRFVGHIKEVLCMTVSKDSQYVLSGGQGKIARYWKLETGREEFAIDGFEGAIKATFITPSRKQGLASDGQTLALIDLKTGKILQSTRLSRRTVQFVTFSEDGKLVAVQDSYAIFIWETQTGTKLPTMQDREIQWSGRFSPDGKHFISGANGKVSMWEVKTGKKIYEFDTAKQSAYVQCLAYSPDNKHFAAIPSSAGQQLQVFRTPRDTH